MADSDYMLRGFRQMLQSDLMGGTIEYNGNTFPACIGIFQILQTMRPDGGGFSPSLEGVATVAWSDLPPATKFTAGQFITANPLAGQSRLCKVVSVKDMGPLVEITLSAQNQGA